MLEPNQPSYYLVKKNFDESGEYEKGFKVVDLFPKNANGIKTQRDDASITFSKAESKSLYDDFINLSEEELKNKYGYADVRDWQVSFAKEDLISNPIIADKLLYRPFDFRYMNYTGKTKGIMGYPRYNVMQHFLYPNIELILVSQPQAANLNYFDCLYITNKISDTNMYRRGGPSAFPLYHYPELNAQQSIFDQIERVPNLNMEMVAKMAEGLGLEFTAEKNTSSPNPSAGVGQEFAPIDILDYIYAVLHSPSYREKYKEFLKIDFPRVPYPAIDTFWQLVKLGGELRQIHLLESAVVEHYITQYPVDGDNVVSKPKYENGNVFINDTQYFANVPELAWNFYIGGYQPAQKWLKDRKDRTLDYKDILHYQKIIVALSETDRIMKEIDGIGVEW